MTKMIVTTFGKNTKVRNQRLVRLLGELPASIGAYICRLHDEHLELHVDWVKLPKNDDAFDAVDKAWLEQGGRVVSHYLKAISIVGCDEPHVFPADRGRQLASMLAYSKPGGMGSFTEFVHNQARARPLTVEHAAITQKMMNQLGPKTLIGMLKSA